MLGSLKGTVIGQLDQRSLIETEGVGYWVHTGAWHPVGTVTTYLYHQVREDISELYGFPTLADLALFEKLISVSGIGPKAGLAIMSLGSSEQIVTAIRHQDTAFLSSAPGIGVKAAQKITLELSNKLDGLEYETGGQQLVISQYQDLRLALEGLGFRAVEITPILHALPSELTEFNAQLKWALQELAKH